jgi:hypothetical protein
MAWYFGVGLLCWLIAPFAAAVLLGWIEREP